MQRRCRLYLLPEQTVTTFFGVGLDGQPVYLTGKRFYDRVMMPTTKRRVPIYHPQRFINRTKKSHRLCS